MTWNIFLPPSTESELRYNETYEWMEAMTDERKDEQLLSDGSLRALEDVCRMGARYAATGMTEMLNATVTPVGLQCRRVDIPQLLSFCGSSDELVVTIAFAVTGEASGDIIAVLPEATASRLSERLLEGMELEGAEREKVRLDSLAELGNVIGSAFLNAVSNLSGLELLPAPPALAEDMAAAACDVLQIRYGALTDKVTVSEVQFALEDEPLAVQLAILFEPESWERILSGFRGEGGRG